MRIFIILAVFIFSLPVYGQFTYLDAKAQRVSPSDNDVMNAVKSEVNQFYGIPQSLIQGRNARFVGELDVFYVGTSDLIGILSYRHGYVRDLSTNNLVYYILDWERSVVVDNTYGLDSLLAYRAKFLDAYGGGIANSIQSDVIEFYDLNPQAQTEFAVPVGSVGNIIQYMVGKGDTRYNIFLYCFIDTGGNVFYYVHDPANGFIVWRGI